MDGNNQAVDQPTVQIFRKSFFNTKKGKAVLILCISIILFVILIVILNYFNVMSKKATSLSYTPVKITLISENYGFKAGELTLDCPVESAFCKSQKLINLRNIGTVGYKAASKSAVLNLTKISHLENIAVLTNKQASKKYFYESVISKDGKSCYTIAYTLPEDVTFQNILNLESFNNKGAIARLGSATFEAANEEANVLIQVRNTPMDPGKACSLIQKSPEFFEFNYL